MAENSKEENSSNKAKPVVDLGILEADDDFEEFPADGCATGSCEDNGEVSLWEDNWDDDIVEEEFSTLLRAEFQKLGKAFVLPDIVPPRV
ncbi:hypothetical protein EGR_03821 [Echinococcus granulosus]|uniref:26S proteasome complex subunit SEM1 n=1 Tax=Echinococcus granulosus TaxID=6210 RepID=W6UIM6_ECHGR|nr:hypothetical protein EGR_03821 [Echinococcus granulosus]EUB61335.1 hypothetical protein EGR_03821 [Echinococcus granulosus]